ncbi:MAG: hypothetical protein ACXU82_05200 [Caulobacteraceae bacterium]
MSDDQTETETPMARALRMKKAALAAKPKPPGGGKFPHRQSAAMPLGASKPAMRK